MPHTPASSTPAPRSQAARIFDKFGGAENLARALHYLAPAKRRDRTAVRRWDYPRSKGGAGGQVPSSAMASVLEAARLYGVLLTADDLDPRSR